MTTYRGFSLLELMIAIMILGIGTVMVATIFPVGLDMTRETIQMDIMQAVTDVAASTLVAKVPGYKQLDGWSDAVSTPAGPAARVLVPDVASTEISPKISPQMQEVTNLWSGPVVPPGTGRSYMVNLGPPTDWAPLGWVGLAPTLQTPVEFVKQCRAYTEQTGWPGEIAPVYEASVVPTQNLPRDYTNHLSGTIDELIKTMILPVFTSSYPPLFPDVLVPRVSLVDQVYPPVATHTYDGKTITARSAGDIATEVASRRYSWLAFNHRVLPDPNQKTAFLVTLAVTFRGDLNSKYARQGDYNRDPNIYNVYFDLNDPDVTHQAAWKQPGTSADLSTPPCLFPVPWLVMFRGIDAGTGKATCTAEVARLLPPGSYFIVAGTVGSYQAGASWKVLTSQWKPGDIGKPASYYNNYTLAADDPKWSSVTIAVTGGTWGMYENVPVWVIPPALDPDPSVTFQTRSPVVGVALRKVVAP